MAYDATCRLNPPSFRRDIVFTYRITVSQPVSEFDAAGGLMSEMADASANGFPTVFYPRPLANTVAEAKFEPSALWGSL